MPRLALTAALALAATALPALAEPSSHNVFGTYFTEAGTSRVTIEDCGDGTPCGRVSWIDPDTLEAGETPESVTTEAGKPVLGLTMLHDFDRKKRDWRGGTIYDPKEDKTYASRLKRLEDGRLQVKGCIGPFCQTQIWREYEGE
ncbi:MAG: DUF2147 domain-containing protein [Henriciella sp.]|uniref:DUF2147 domain-containing protein n=1 Tax=Henriciella sp. TaxID=1968823 RepID=UPI0032EC7E38